MNIAIDGPSGAGKSTVAKQLATKLRIPYLDTGAMYRAIGLKVYNSKLEASDSAKIEKLLPKTKIDMVLANGETKVMLDDKDVSVDIRQHFMSRIASDVSAIPAVRIWLVEMQRKIAQNGSCVLDGRDIGSFVLPNAEYKFFLTATSDIRAKRRHLELTQKGEKTDLAKIKADIEQRDYNDSNRVFAPLKKVDDAIEIDSTDLSIAQVVEQMLWHISAVGNN